MGTMPPRARKRLRVIDADTDDLSTIDPSAVDWDEENRLCVADTVTAPETSVERAAEIEERRRKFRNAYVALKPAALAAYHAMSEALEGHGDTIGRRLTSTRSDALLLSVRMPDNLWQETFHAALKVLLAFITCTDPDVETSYAVAVPQSDRWHGSEYVFQTDAIMRDLLKGHVVMLHGPQIDLQPALAPLIDVALDLSAMPPRYLEQSVQRLFDLDETKAWLGPPVAQLKPALFDAACARAADWTEVAWILNRLARAELDEAALAAKAEQSEKDKKTTTSSAAKSLYVPEILYPTAPKLAELHGYGAASKWGLQTAQDIALYKRGEIAWEDVDAGVLLSGPPGTGKTTFAKAFAAECGVPFIAASYAQWQSSGDGHLGYVLKAIRKTFETAEGLPLCMLLIDEIDAIRGRGRGRDADGWWTAIVTCLLECLDGTTRREGVIVIGACNVVENLDAAMIRSGRLDRHFEIGLPDEAALLGIMRHHLPSAALADLAPAATVLAGSTSGADVARIARDARRIARREKRPVTAADLLAIAIPVDTLSERDRRLVAVHEAGHAVAVMCAGRVPDALSIVSGGASHGAVRAGGDGIGMGRLGDFESEVVIRLAGRAAEEVVLGEPSAGAEHDLLVATTLVVQLIGKAGLGGRLLHSESIDGHAVEGRLRDLYGQALRLVGERRVVVEALADLAIERRVLGRAVLVEFAAEHGLGGAR